MAVRRRPPERIARIAARRWRRPALFKLAIDAAEASRVGCDRLAGEIGGDVDRVGDALDREHALRPQRPLAA